VEWEDVRGEEVGASELRRQHLRELLLRYLIVAGCPQWPGADGQTVEEVLHSYSQAAAAGRVPDRRQLLLQHPDLADELLAFFARDDDPRER
jgi:hypothetical protein